MIDYKTAINEIKYATVMYIRYRFVCAIIPTAINAIESIYKARLVVVWKLIIDSLDQISIEKKDSVVHS